MRVAKDDGMACGAGTVAVGGICVATDTGDASVPTDTGEPESEDADGDGYRTTEVVESIDDDCQDAGEATMDVPLVDCDDTRAGVNPGADEIEGDGVDQDCDGTDPAGDAVASDDTASPSGSADGDASDAPIEVTVEMDAPAAEKGGCSTAGSASGGTVGWAVALLGLAGLRRRRAA